MQPYRTLVRYAGTAAWLFLSSYAAAQTATPGLTTLHDFKTQDGTAPSSPIGGVILGENGALYGTSAYGGTNGTSSGTVYELLPPATGGGAWTAVTLYSFTGINGDGVRPIAGLVMGANGEIYGATTNGGTGEYGTVYEVQSPSSPGGTWTETVLHSFQGGQDGAFPYGNLVIGRNGELYGTTYQGGYIGSGSGGCLGIGCGTVFKLEPPSTPGGSWTGTILHRFTGSNGKDGQPLDGEQPLAGVIIGSHGEIYGTASGGGNECLPFNGCGVVFELQPPSQLGGAWTESILHAFNYYPADGFQPFAAVALDSGGKLYGTTYWGGTGTYCFYACGTVFELQPSSASGGAWTETILHSFADPTADGFTPIAGVIVGRNGQLYGATTAGGSATTCQTAPGQYYCGALYELTPPVQAGGVWSEKILYNFTGQFGVGDGSDPHATLVQGKDGALYGTTTGGGIYGWGTAFQF